MGVFDTCFDTYFGATQEVLKKIYETQKEKIEYAAEKVAETIKADGIIYVFGCGHSHLVAGDAFYRAGGLANVSAVFDTDLMLHNGAAKSSVFERMQGLAEPIYDRYCITEKDTLIVVSTSGKNCVPIEMAQCGVKNGVFTLAVCSSSYFGETSKHPSGKLLYNSAEFFIDNCVPKGDATVEIGDSKMGAVSTAASCFIVNSVLVGAAGLANEAGKKPPVYKSGNVEGGAEFNKALIDAYRSRIKHL